MLKSWTRQVSLSHHFYKMMSANVFLFLLLFLIEMRHLCTQRSIQYNTIQICKFVLHPTTQYPFVLTFPPCNISSSSFLSDFVFHSERITHACFNVHLNQWGIWHGISNHSYSTTLNIKFLFSLVLSSVGYKFCLFCLPRGPDNSSAIGLVLIWRSTWKRGEWLYRSIV